MSLHIEFVMRDRILEYLLIVVSVLLIFSVSACGINYTDFSGDVATKDEATLSQATKDVVQTECETITATVIVPTETQSTVDSKRSNPDDVYDATGFVSITDVIPDAILEIRYYSTYNFIGDRVNGYEEPIALLSKEAAVALKKVSDELRDEGYRLKIFDAYRPQIAVDHFASWASDVSDTRMKEYFYPDIDKSLLFDYGYIAYRSGHSRGCTVDLTLFDIKTGKEVDMGGPFDYFGSLSHPDYTGVTDEQYQNRMILREAMLNNGFRACPTEWWDFTLVDEPYPYTYFSFPVSTESLENR